MRKPPATGMLIHAPGRSTSRDSRRSAAASRMARAGSARQCMTLVLAITAPAGHERLNAVSPLLRCLVTGASGYVGGRLVPELLGSGHAVRFMTRDFGKLGDRPWSGDVQVSQADTTDPNAVRRALQGVDVAYYLVHSLGLGGSFEQRDRAAARVFADGAKSAGVRRIVYLGGIVSGDPLDLSPHVRSRAEVGDILLGSGVPTAVL